MLDPLYYVGESFGLVGYHTRSNGAPPVPIKDRAKAQWLSWLERRPVTAEVTGSSPVWVVSEILFQFDDTGSQRVFPSDNNLKY